MALVGAVLRKRQFVSSTHGWRAETLHCNFVHLLLYPTEDRVPMHTIGGSSTIKEATLTEHRRLIYCMFVLA